MNTKESKDTKLSPKDKEKLKQRLQTLFKQDKKDKKSTSKIRLEINDRGQNKEKMDQQVNGYPEAKSLKQKSKHKNRRNADDTQGESGNKKNVVNNQSSVKPNKKESFANEWNSKQTKVKNNTSHKNLPSKGMHGKSQSKEEAVLSRGEENKYNLGHDKHKNTTTPDARKSKKTNDSFPAKSMPNGKFKFNQKNRKPKSFQTKPEFLSNTTTNAAKGNESKLSGNQKKNSKKRPSPSTFDNSEHTQDSKKPKLTSQEGNNQKRKKKPRKNKKNKVPHIQSRADNGLDIKNMPGFVKGGDFDSDHDSEYAGDEYWEKQYSKNFLDSEASDDYENHNSKRNEIKLNGGKSNGYISPDDPFDYSDLEEDEVEESDFDPYNYSDLSEEDEHYSNFNEDNHEEEDEESDFDPYNYSDLTEEEEHYSDFDEDDYEEDDDSYDYSSDSEFSSSFDLNEKNENGDKSYDFNDEEEDDDYKLPDDVPEDLIIHSGTAIKRDILPEDNVVFKDKKYCQIIELKHERSVKVIHQPTAYKKEELMKLKYSENQTVNIVATKTNEETLETAYNGQMLENSNADSNSDCPQLVPIVDKDGFELYNPNENYDDIEIDSQQDDLEYADDSSMDNVSLGSEYSIVNSEDADSLMSEDINDKYLYRNENYISDDDYNNEELRESLSTVDIIDTTKCNYIEEKHMQQGNTSDEDEDQLPTQSLSQRIKVGSKGTVVITDISTKDQDKIINTQKEREEIILSVEKQSESLMATECRPNENESKVNDSIEEILENYDHNHEQTSPPSNTQLSLRCKPIVNQSLSNYNTIFCNAIDANLVLVLVKDPFYIYGTVKLTLLAGAIDIYGHSLIPNKEVEIFSPRGCSVIEISSLPCTDERNVDKETIQKSLNDYRNNFLHSGLENILTAYEEGKDAIVLMKRNEERKKVVHQFKKFMNENVFPNLQNINIDRPLYNSEYLLRCMINTSSVEQKCLRLPQQWQQLEVTETSRILLAGGKGVGKSTLLRYLVNKELPKTEKVLLIDLDIGQPEIFIPQTISCSLVRKPLLGPGFFLNIQPEKAFAVGHTNIALCPHTYVAAVRQLLDYCIKQENFRHIPWFINTMGYNKGFGLELISLIIKSLALTDVIQLQSTKDINNFDSLLFPNVVSAVPSNMFVEDYNEEKDTKLDYRIHIWQSALIQDSRYQKEWDMSPKDIRYSMVLTRLSQALQGHAEWLTDCKPISCPLDHLKLINLMDNIPPCSRDEVAKAMEANIVYLCHFDDSQNAIECLGIGVVRAIDYHVRQVYLVPAMHKSLLKQVNCLALGDMPLPNSMFTNQGSRVKNTAPFVYNTIEDNASKAIKQIYHRPKNFLTGKNRPLN
ncbi:uncharacterized protein LOC142238452 [Haematobia irritans]|uniref:uncharacterized protein LOC142238452 n=1 Tax=Haematobia irritans TaxID=7368 RepID=UPI003F50A559